MGRSVVDVSCVPPQSFCQIRLTPRFPFVSHLFHEPSSAGAATILQTTPCMAGLPSASSHAREIGPKYAEGYPASMSTNTKYRALFAGVCVECTSVMYYSRATHVHTFTHHIFQSHTPSTATAGYLARL